MEKRLKLTIDINRFVEEYHKKPQHTNFDKYTFSIDDPDGDGIEFEGPYIHSKNKLREYLVDNCKLVSNVVFLKPSNL